MAWKLKFDAEKLEERKKKKLREPDANKLSGDYRYLDMPIRASICRSDTSICRSVPHGWLITPNETDCQLHTPFSYCN